jgi:hypothetical protein
MMVRFIHTSVAKIAVLRRLRLQIFTVNAHKIQVDFFLQKSLNQAKKILLLRNIARIDQSQHIEKSCHGKRDKSDYLGIVKKY